MYRVLIGVWFVASLTLSLAGKFRDIPPAGLLLPGLIVTSLVYLVLFSVSRGFRQFATALSLRWVTLLEAGRIIGGTYILFDPKLPGLFALPTGISDVIIGVSAPFAAKYLLTRDGQPKPGFFLWHAVGLFWIGVSVVTGSISGAPAISAFPLSLIPTFLGPMVILCHLVALSRPKHSAAYAALPR